MKPQKALELVVLHAKLTKQIRETTKEIGGHLDLCKGFSGQRGEPFAHREDDGSGRDVDLHLTAWYRPIREPDIWSDLSWQHINANEHGQECPHCYAAHLAIEVRKEARKQLGIVRRSMSRAIK